MLTLSQSASQVRRLVTGSGTGWSCAVPRFQLAEIKSDIGGTLRLSET